MSRQLSLLVELSATVPLSIPASETLAVCVFTDTPRLPAAESFGGSLRDVCERAVAEGEFKGEEETSLLIHAASAEDFGGESNVGSSSESNVSGGESNATRGGVRRVLLVGLGSHADFDPATLRRAAALAVRAARSSRARTLCFVVPQSVGGHAREAVRALAEGAHLGLYRNDFYQKIDEDDVRKLERVTFVGAGEVLELRGELARARVVAESANWARTLADEPGLSLPPREFARRAAEMAAEVGLKVESLTAEEIRAQGMGGLIGVGQGSDEEPALIVLRYEPEGATEDDELWAFVGKGITFDTGGISIKHGLEMYEMKSDMAGGAAALGALRAIALLKPKRRVVAVVPAAENMPSGKAIKPGDIVRTFAGQTIECVDTDAEGRLVLVDGIAYAKHLGATRIVDLATLTGSIIIALGSHRTGLFSNTDEWANRVLAASARAGEPAWRMPVSDDYKKRIESMIADFKNYGGRPDATAAALLLSKFAGETPWVHLDIAGTAWYDAATPYAPKGASGTGIRTLVELACADGIRNNEADI
ncbi:MAG: leucyl aminopeptidase [Acidobacteriota bacterium]|jgi:leucyl aminopeptidase|nr:leucyl aminopeptidase [Acidobacteriota bacterium]